MTVNKHVITLPDGHELTVDDDLWIAAQIERARRRGTDLEDTEAAYAAVRHEESMANGVAAAKKRLIDEAAAMWAAGREKEASALKATVEKTLGELHAQLVAQQAATRRMLIDDYEAEQTKRSSCWRRGTPPPSPCGSCPDCRGRP